MKIAAVQMDVTLKDVEINLRRMVDSFTETAVAGAELTIFPECAVTGYCFESLEEAQPYAQPIPSQATNEMSAACADHGAHAIFGMLETDDAGHVFNTAVLVGPGGVDGTYRKVHLPFLGVDMFTTFGDRPFAVHQAGDLNVGMNICYDAAFPEAARSLAIQGADLIALPTNWPPGAQCVAENTINSRAMENGVYYAAVNRVGTERGFTFIGRSRICDPSGRTIAQAPESGETILYAEIDPARARTKHIVRVPGRHEIDRMADRRPEMYAAITEPHNLRRPGREEGH